MSSNTQKNICSEWGKGMRTEASREMVNAVSVNGDKVH